MRGIGPLAEGGDWLAPEYTTSLGEPPTGACGCLTVSALWHAALGSTKRIANFWANLGTGGGSCTIAAGKTPQRALAALLGCVHVS